MSPRVTVMVPFAAFSAALQCFPAKKNTDTGGQGGEEDPAVEDPAADGPEEEGGANTGTGILIVVKLAEAPAIVEPAIG